MSQEKTQAELLKEELFFEKKHFSNQMSDEELAKADAFCDNLFFTIFLHIFLYF